MEIIVQIKRTVILYFLNLLLLFSGYILEPLKPNKKRGAILNKVKDVRFVLCIIKTFNIFTVCIRIIWKVLFGFCLLGRSH